MVQNKRFYKLVLLSLIAFGLIFPSSNNVHAHVNSPDIFAEVAAGPYSLLVQVHPPRVIPGPMDVNMLVRPSTKASVKSISVWPIPPQGESAAPPPEKATRSTTDPHYFTTQILVLTPGVWKLQLRVSGLKEEECFSIDVPTHLGMPSAMDRRLGSILLGLGIFLFISGGAIAAAAARESMLDPGVTPTPRDVRRGRMAMLYTLAVLAAIVFVGNAWWRSLAQGHLEAAQSPPTLKTSREEIPSGEPVSLKLEVISQGRYVKDIVPDHGKLMHLLMVRHPYLDRFVHVHPEQIAPGIFTVRFTPGASGTYRLYGDILTAGGNAWTLTQELRVLSEGETGSFVLVGEDDSQAQAVPVSSAGVHATVADLGGGLQLKWLRPANVPLRANVPAPLQFELIDAGGRPQIGLDAYLGMAGHLIVMGAEGNVYAHAHSMGPMPMAPSDFLGGTNLVQPAMMMRMMNHTIHTSTVSFPYAFPRPGLYRLWVQIKRNGQVRTGVFTTKVVQ